MNEDFHSYVCVYISNVGLSKAHTIENFHGLSMK